MYDPKYIYPIFHIMNLFPPLDLCCFFAVADFFFKKNDDNDVRLLIPVFKFKYKTLLVGTRIKRR